MKRLRRLKGAVGRNRAVLALRVQQAILKLTGLVADILPEDIKIPEGAYRLEMSNPRWHADVFVYPRGLPKRARRVHIYSHVPISKCYRSIRLQNNGDGTYEAFAAPLTANKRLASVRVEGEPNHV